MLYILVILSGIIAITSILVLGFVANSMMEYIFEKENKKNNK
jgi:FtsZ-interacting cell division protein ZipA